MRKKILQLIVILVAFCQMQAIAQTNQVTGRVVGPDNNPVVGASVTIDGTTSGTITDENGNFSISAPAGASLLISSVNFADQTLKVDGRSVVNVTLAAGQSSGLDEVVVTGYTAQRKKDIVGAVAVVDVKALKAVPSGSAASAIQGQAAGVNVINTGSPGATSSILIRGVTGFANNPLILIDGIQGNLNDVPANDVESIQVLKDASAAAIYGARGSNGVVIITTRRGKSGAPSVVYDSYYNLQMPRSLKKLDLLNAEDYGNILYSINPSALFNGDGSFKDFSYRGPVSRGYANAGDPLVDPNNYFLDLKDHANQYIIQPIMKNQEGDVMYNAITRNALMHQHNITASGGNDRATYLMSLGYIDHQGIVMNSYMKRYNARINSTYKVRDNIRIGQNLNIQYRDNPSTVGANGGFGALEGAFMSTPMMPLYDIRGNYGGNFAQSGGLEMGEWTNSLATVNNWYNNRGRTYGIQGNAFLEVDFFKDLTFRSSVGGTIDNNFYQSYSPRGYWAREGVRPDGLTETSGFRTLLQFTNTLNYKKQFGLHNLNVLVGTESIETKWRNSYATAGDFFLSTYQFLVFNNAQIRSFPPAHGAPHENVLNLVGDQSLASLISRLEYQYNDKYLLTATARRDGFSSFGSDNRYGNFFSLGLGWRISEESFMKNVVWVNDLKLRASYGELGNNSSIGPANAFSTYGTDPRFSSYDMLGLSNSVLNGFYPNTIGNSVTSWELNKQTNIGFDATLFNNKFDISAEYFKKATEGLLRNIEFPAMAGEGTPPAVNFGNIENVGFDINAMYRARFSNDFSMNFGVNFTTYKSKVVLLPSPGYYDEWIYRLAPGQPMGSYFGYKIVGLFNDQRSLDESADQQDKALGRWRYQDTDGDGTITNLDRVFLGDPNPDFTVGLNIGANFKGFDFQATFYSAVGQDIRNGVFASGLGSWEMGATAKAGIVRDAWSPSNPNGTWKVAEQNRNFSNTPDHNDQFIEKGSFVRLRNLQIGYTFTGNKIQNSGLNSVRVFVGGTNLFLITKYSGLDPEVYGGFVGLNGSDNGSYYQAPGIVGGLRVSF